MNFSESFKFTKKLAKLSPDANYVAAVLQYRITVRRLHSLQVEHVFSCLDEIEHFSWSPDSRFLLCALYQRNLIQIWCLDYPDWTCKIDEGITKVMSVLWAPDSRHVITTSEFSVRLTVWSLVTKSVSYIKYPKQCREPISFTQNSKFMALAERRDCKDFISVFDSKQWQLISHFPAETQDLDGIRWSPDDSVICVWDDCLQYNIILFSLDGRRLATFSPTLLTKRPLLGVKSVAFSPSSQFLAIGSCDRIVRLLNNITWRPITEFEHCPVLADDNVVVYQEYIPDTTQPRSLLQPLNCRYDVITTPTTLSSTTSSRTASKSSSSSSQPSGVSSLGFSADSRYLYSVEDSLPNCVFIWDVHRLRLIAVLSHLNSVKACLWDPVQTRLAVCCNSTDRIFMWCPAGALAVRIPQTVLSNTRSEQDKFELAMIEWSEHSNALLLCGRKQWCMCYIDDSEPTDNVNVPQS